LNNFAKDSFFMFIGSALRIEEPLLNLIIRRAAIGRGGVFFNIGSRLSSNYYIKHIGGTFRSFFQFMAGNHWASNLYFKSLYSFFCFGGAFFKSSVSYDIFNEFVRRGFGLRGQDTIFFAGNVPAVLSATIMGLQTRNAGNLIVDYHVNPLLIDFSFSSLFSNPSAFDKNRILVSFDHSFNTVNRGVSDIIIPVRNFLENKKAVFVNSFYEILRNNVSFVRDVEKLFSVFYKKSYDFLVYDSKIINFGLVRASMLGTSLDSQNGITLKTCQFAPLLFFTYEHLYNTADFLIFRKFLSDCSIFINASLPGYFSFFVSNNLLFLPRQNNVSFVPINWFKTLQFLNLNKLSLATNRVYFDPENDVFSNGSALLLKTYKRLVIQMSNFK
jgi:hypothetical protein